MSTPDFPRCGAPAADGRVCVYAQGHGGSHRFEHLAQSAVQQPLAAATLPPPMSTTPPSVAPTATPTATNRLRPWMVVLIAIGSFVLGVAVGNTADSSTPTAGAGPTGGQTTAAAKAAAAPTTTTAAPKPVVLPKPADFTIKVKVLSKECFGSAGCNLIYQIEPTYVGATPLPNKTVTVVYEVQGGEDPQINRFTISGGTASYESEEHISTSSSKAELTAVVTDVF